MTKRTAVRRRLLAEAPDHGPRAPAWPQPPAPAWPQPPARVRAALADAALPLGPEVAWSLWLGGCALVVAAAVVAGGPALAMLGLTAGAVGSWWGLRARRGRAVAALVAQLPDALEAIARSLRSGASLRQAIGEARSCGGVLAAELATVVAELDHGVGLVEALDRWQARRPLPAVSLAVAALSLGAETGGAQARAVDGVAATLRDRLAVAADVRAHAAQVRASVLVINLAPIAFCAFATATDPRTADFLFRSPLGWSFLAAGVSLDAVSALWMRRLARVRA